MAAPDEEFRVKSLTWHGRDTYMLMQGDNGPCPLLALCNVLLLRNSIALPRPGAPNVAQSELTALLAEYMLESNPVTEASPPDLAANLTDAMALFPKLGRGLDVNVRFDAVDGLEYSEDLLIFDLLRVRLLHGWLVDPQDTATAAAVGSRSYNQLVERIIEIQSLTQANAAAEPDAPPPPPPEAAAPYPGADPFPAADPIPAAGGAAAAAEAPQGTDADCSEDEEMRQAMQLSLGLASPPPSPPPSPAAADPFPSPAQPALRRSDSMAVREALLLTEWLNGSASQLSYHGLVQLHASLAEAELAVFFRNNHFATITKHGGELYLLATDVGFAREPLVVWERLNQIDGDSTLCTSEFERVEESLTTTATEEAAAAAIAADIAEAEAREAAGLGPAQDEASDMALAIQLQREEEEQAQLAEQQMQQMQLQREQALAAQQGYGPAGPAPAYPGQPYRQQQQQQQPPQQQQRGNCLLQ